MNAAQTLHVFGEVTKGYQMFTRAKSFKICNTIASFLPSIYTQEFSLAYEEESVVMVCPFHTQTVEGEQPEKLQAQALSVLFSLIRHHPEHAREFRNMDGYAMLIKVLHSSRCTLGFHMLKVLLDSVTSQPVMQYSLTSQQHCLDSETDALLHDMQVR